MTSLKFFILIVAILICGCAAKKEKACDQRNENIYTKSANNIKKVEKWSIIPALNKLYEILLKFYEELRKVIEENSLKFIKSFANFIEGLASFVSVKVE